MRRGPKTSWTDEQLTELIREDLATTPWLGEGHRKVWARLRVKGVRTSQRRALRLMREAGLLAPSRARRELGPRVHDGTIITERPNEMWATDATATMTLEDGQVTVFIAVDHCTAECVGIHIVGWARERAAARIFLLDRVTQVHRTGEHFERRSELPQGVFEQGAFGLWEGEAKLVRLKFNGTAAQIVSEQRLHPSQRILDHSASSLTMELLVPLSPALVSWVTGFGKRVEVLEPESLRAQL